MPLNLKHLFDWRPKNCIFLVKELNSFEECQYICAIKENNCTDDPRVHFIYGEYNFNCDIRFKQIYTKKCINQCKKQCREHYFNIQREFAGAKNNNIVTIKSRNLPIFEYTFEAKYSLFIYISNIGGLMSLWFGFAAIDIYTHGSNYL